MQGEEAYIVDAVRTPIGKFGGALAGIRPDDLGARMISALLERTPALDPADVDEVILGAANQAGEDNRNVARMASLLAGLPASVPGVTVNRLCASGLEAVIAGARAIAVGDASIVIAGGVESMSRAPYVLPKPERPYPAGHAELYSTTLGWRMTNPKMPPEWAVSLGECTEQLAEAHNISRDAADAFAAHSHERAGLAWAQGKFDGSVVQVVEAPLARDECIRDGVTTETLARLRPAFRDDGVTTAGNASPLNDGAAALVLADANGLRRLGREPLARIVSSAVHAVDPRMFGIAPVEAVRKALAKAKTSLSDVKVLELNEAFAVQSAACVQGWPELDPEVVNPWGGAIAVGHPLGSSGARLAGTVAHQLVGLGGGVGVATLCVGVGQGLALVMER